MTITGNSDATLIEGDPNTTSEGDCNKALNSNKNSGLIKEAADGSSYHQQDEDEPMPAITPATNDDGLSDSTSLPAV